MTFSPASATHPHALLADMGERLAAADLAMLSGDLQAMHDALKQALQSLCALARQGHIAQRQSPSTPPWDSAAALPLLWQLLAAFKSAGCGVFAFAGTLLGLERDGQLLRGDKDADLGVWLEDFGLACALLPQWGWRRAGNMPPFSNMASFVDARSGLSVDLFGIRRDAVHQRLEGGVWMYGQPASHQRITHYPWLELGERATPAGSVWWPQPADGLLTALYGDWRTRRPGWDSLVSCLAVQELNLHWRCWALKNLCDRWLTGNLPATLDLLDQIETRAGAEPSLQQYREALQPTRAR